MTAIFPFARMSSADNKPDAVHPHSLKLHDYSLTWWMERDHVTQPDAQLHR